MDGLRWKKERTQKTKTWAPHVLRWVHDNPGLLCRRTSWNRFYKVGQSRCRVDIKDRSVLDAQLGSATAQPEKNATQNL